MSTSITYQSSIEIVDLVYQLRARMAFGETPADWSELVDIYGASMLFFAHVGVQLLLDKPLTLNQGEA